MPKIIDDEQVLEAALQTIITYGYDGATTRLIAAAAQINEVTLFRKFGSKEHIILLAVQQELRAFHTANVGYTGDLQADLEQIVRFYDALFAHRAKFIPVIVNEAPRHPELLAGIHALSVIVEELTAIIRRYQEEQQLDPQPPLHMLLALLSPVLAYHIASSFAATPSMPFSPTAHVRLFLTGYQTSASSH